MTRIRAELIEELVDLVAPWFEAGEQENGDYIDPDNLEMVNSIRGHIREIERENITKILEHLQRIEWGRREFLQKEITIAQSGIEFAENNFLPGPNGERFISDNKILIERLTLRLEDLDL